MLKWNSSTQEFAVYSPKSTANPFDLIHMGEGQFLNTIPAAGTLIHYNKTET